MQLHAINQETCARVLVIDDDDALTYTLARALSAPDVQVEVANDAPAGLGIIRRHCPDLVIVDLHMPEMDGVQFIEACRRMPEGVDVPIFLATGDGDIRTVRKRVDGNRLVLVVPKPFDLDILMAAVHAVISARVRRKERPVLEATA